MLPVTLTCWSNEEHLSQVFTGLTMLHHAERIQLTQKMLPTPPPNLSAEPHLKHIKNWHCRIEAGGKRFYVDTQDGPEIDRDGLASCDVYLKRSYSGGPAKVKPLGLNYEVFAAGFDFREIARRLRYQSARCVASYLLRRHPRSVKDFEGGVIEGKFEPHVLFTCRAWEPNQADPQKNEERVAINDMRAQLILALRHEFGARCLAGFSGTDHARRLYRRAVLEPDCSAQRAYIQRMKRTPICIATMGLHGSNGWKLAEYVAANRAIVSETLHYQAPHFEAGTNYLPFVTVAECLEQVGKLMDSNWECQKLSMANLAYYRHHLRPDRLVSDALGLDHSSMTMQSESQSSVILQPNQSGGAGSSVPGQGN